MSIGEAILLSFGKLHLLALCQDTSRENCLCRFISAGALCLTGRLENKGKPNYVSGVLSRQRHGRSVAGNITACR